ncbi:MAG: hypothetical protein KGI60_01095 [Patescibacteria group bacterium]|nr:hypothetical protein [Patescibacteria group bacterium]
MTIRMGLMSPARSRRMILIALAVILNAVMVFELTRVVRQQRALFTLYISKSDCSYTPTKKAVVFLDDRSRSALKRFGLTIDEIVTEANAVMRENRVPGTYDTRHIIVRSWNTDTSKCKFYNSEFENQYWCFTHEMGPRAETVRRLYDPDVLIFVTSNGIWDMTGRAFWKKKEGNGTIVMNLGKTTETYDSDERLRRVAKKFFRRRFAQLLVHEQAHLYGLPHSRGRFSIMNQETDDFGDRRTRFNPDSRSALIRRILALEDTKHACAATP